VFKKKKENFTWHCRGEEDSKKEKGGGKGGQRRSRKGQIEETDPSERATRGKLGTREKKKETWVKVHKLRFAKRAIQVVLRGKRENQDVRNGPSQAIGMRRKKGGDWGRGGGGHACEKRQTNVPGNQKRKQRRRVREKKRE